MQAKLGDGVIISGTLPKDAELRHTQSNVPLCKFGVKVGNKQVGETKEAIWVNCVCWRNVAMVAANFCKGDTVLAWGKPQTRTYTGKDGEEKTSTELVCEFAVKMPSVIAGVSAAHAAPSAPSGAFTDITNVSDDELPF